MNTAPLYIGGDVYVSYDGYAFWLSSMDHKHRIALQPDVLYLFNRYIEQTLGVIVEVTPGNKITPGEPSELRK